MEFDQINSELFHFVSIMWSEDGDLDFLPSVYSYYVFHEGLVTYMNNVLGEAAVLQEQWTILNNFCQFGRVPLIAMEV